MSGSTTSPSEVEAHTPAPAATHQGLPRLTWIPALDGMRGVGILANLGYHFGVPGFGGGYMLLDTFFVLSGFLITTLLLVDWSWNGTLSFSMFWTRRARRLLPAMLIVVCAVVLIEAVHGDPAVWKEVRGSALATLFYSANWFFIATNSNYFGRLEQMWPLQHTWTLSIEEQFYIAWPLLLWVLLRWRRSPGIVIWVAGVGAICSSLWMWHVYANGAGINHAYYGTDCRAEALLTGATLAALVTKRPFGTSAKGARNWNRAGVLAVLVGAVLIYFAAGAPGWLFHGGFLLTELLEAVVLGALVFAPKGSLVRVFTFRPLRWFGKISYGLYLWLMPTKVFLTVESTHLPVAALMLLRSVVAIGLAAAMYYLVENPIRRGNWLKAWKAWAVTPVAVTITGTAALVLGAAAPVASAADLPSTTVPDIPVSLVAKPLRVLVVGDSMASSLAVGVSAVARDYGAVIYNDGMFGCGVLTTGVVNEMGVVGPEAGGEAQCVQWRRTYAEDMAYVHPDVSVFSVGAGELLDHDWGGEWEHIGERDFDRRLVSALDDAVDILSAGRTPVMLVTSPYYDLGVQANGRPWMDVSVMTRRVEMFNAILRQVAASSAGRATVLDVGSRVSDGDRYAEYRNGIQVRDTDGVHYTVYAGEWLAPWMMPRILRAGLDHRGRPAGTVRGTRMPTTVPLPR